MTIVESVGWVLLHFVWQGAAIALALAVLLAMTGEAQARLRYALSCGALTLMLIAALTTAATVLPDAASPGPRWGGIRNTTAAGPAGLRPGTIAPDRSGGAALAPAAAAGSAAPEAPAGLVRRIVEAVDPTMPWLVGGWIVGVLLLSIRLLGGWWGTRALRVSGVSPVPDWCREQLAALSERMQVTRPVAIVCSVRLAVPVIVGHAKPLIVLPAAALSGLSAGQLEAIVAHELAHVRRNDYLVNLAQTVIETLLFYHPAVWWVSRQVRVSREHCCDDLAVAVCRSRQDYVHALLDLEELRGSSALLALGATDGSLLARGRRLLAPPQGGASSARLAASVIGLTVVAAAAVSASRNASLSAAVVPSSIVVAGQPTAPAIGTDGESPATAPGAQTGTAATTAPVVMAPDPAATLDSRWAWAERAAQAAGPRRYWIGYRISPVTTLPAFVYIDRSAKVTSGGAVFSGHFFSRNATGLRFPGRLLALPAGENHGIKVLFEFENGRGGPALRAVHASTLSIPVDTKDLPVFWLGPADAAQSLDRVDRFYRAVSNADVKHDLLGAAGVHDASPAVVAWLERRVASQDSDDLRGDAAEWMAWHPIAASVAALDRIARTDRSSHVRQEAAEALGDVALPEAAPVLIALARSLPDHDARLEAVEALGARPELAARDALGTIARQDASLDIQREAVETLGDFEDQRGVPLLTELARTHPSVDVRRQAIEALGDAMPEDTVLPLLEKLVTEDPDPGVQEEAIETIAGLEHPGALAILMNLARSHSSVNVRREAVEALGERASGQGQGSAGRDQSAILELLSALAATDRDTEVQFEAVEALAEIGGASAIAHLRKLAESHSDEQVRTEAIESLAESGAAAADTAAFLKRLALADSSLAIQSEAMETLADLPDGAGIAALVDLARDHPRPEARRQALEALLESEHPAARAVFERALGKKPPAR